MEYNHHGDALVPRQQRFGLYARSLMAGLGAPVENRFGLRPALAPGTNKPSPLSVARDLDSKGWLNGITNFNFHMHLPHYAVTTDDTKSVRTPQDRVRIQSRLKIKNVEHLRERHLPSPLSQGLLGMTDPERHRARTQKYRSTFLGCSEL